ncbi:serine/threonine-protein kinase [Stratiformator vulcanicus]|nr:serine/threonine-protein kinase [Stratiformator vulcanicus]
MALSELRKLAEQLVGERLVTKTQVREIAAELNVKEADVDAFFKVAVRKGILTSFHVERIKKGELDGLVLGDYRLLFKAAAGSFARVFKAESLRDGRIFAIKLLRNRHAMVASEVARFHREAKLLMTLRHRNIVPIFDVGNEGEHHFFVMEFVGGGNLRELVTIRKRFEPVEACQIIYQIAKGLEYALERGVSHRDLKSSNVLMTETGVIKLVDFGLAGHDDQYGLDDQRVVEYTVLEKVSRAPDDDPRSDLYFLGVIFFELLVGRSPLRKAVTYEERKEPSRYTMLDPIRRVQPTLALDVAEVVDHLLRVDPAHRFQTPKEVADELARVLRNMNESVPGEAPNRPPPRPLEKPRPSVMCVDHRPAFQDKLRDYLSKRGFRVMIVSDSSRAVARLRNNPPDAILLMGDSVGDELFEAFDKIQEWSNDPKVACVAVLGESLIDRSDELCETGSCRIVKPPIVLRDIRRELYLALSKVLSDSRMIMLPKVGED